MLSRIGPPSGSCVVADASQGLDILPGGIPSGYRRTSPAPSRLNRFEWRATEAPQETKCRGCNDSFDQLVGRASSVGRHFEAERFRLITSSAFVSCWTEVSRPLALENATTAGQHFRRIVESMPTR